MIKIILAFAICASVCLPLAQAQETDPSKIEGTKPSDGQADQTLLKAPIQNTSTAELKKKDKSGIKHKQQSDPSRKMTKPHTEINTTED